MLIFIFVAPISWFLNENIHLISADTRSKTTINNLSEAENVVRFGLENYLECIDFLFINSELRGKEAKNFKEIVERVLWKIDEPQSLEVIEACQEERDAEGEHLGNCSESDCDECQGWKDRKDYVFNQ